MLRLTCGLIFMLGVAAAPAWAERLQTSAGPVEVTAMAGDLDTPWSVAFLPNGEVLVTERDGALLRIGANGVKTRITGVPEVRADGQGGLLDVVLDPGFSENATLYLSFAEADGVYAARTAVARAQLAGDRLDGVQVIFRQIPSRPGGRHLGSRIVPDGNGNLFITTGDRGDRPLVQRPDTHIGKVIRIRTDGTVPPDNPFAADGPRAGEALPEIWSMGHRNAQGAALDEAGRLWTTSHGPRGGDEINRPEPGRNYGWPVISYGEHYSGGQVGEGTHKDGMEQPVWYWDPSIAPSGMMIYSGKLWPGWAGDIFVGSLKFDHISRLDRDTDGTTITGEERLFPGTFNRIRDVREAPDGAIWFLAVGDDTLYRMVPAP